jgi:hypothetical protein
VKKQALIVASLCLFVGLVVLPAYSQARGVQVVVPFEFVISGKTLPAGEYAMIACPLGVAIQDEHGITIATILARRQHLLANRLRTRRDASGGQVQISVCVVQERNTRHGTHAALLSHVRT